MKQFLKRFLLVLGLLIPSSNALSCYGCIGCNEPFTPNSLFSITCESTDFFCYVNKIFILEKNYI
jgi:hypothetical protein